MTGMIQSADTLGKLFKERINKTPQSYVLGWIENNEVKNLTFSEYKNIIESLVVGFHHVGINTGDKIALLAQTSKEWHLLDMATMLSRSCLVPIYPSYLPQEVATIFIHSDSKILIVENDKQMDKVIAVLDKLKNLKIIISINDLSEDTIKKFRNYCAFYTYKEILRIGKEELKTHPDLMELHLQNQQPEELATIVYTSGTTGEPKGAVITQHALVSMLKNVEISVKGAFGPKDRTFIFLPLSHVLGRCDSLLPIIFGWQAVYSDSLEKIAENLLIVKPTIMIAVPRIFEKIYAKILEELNQSSFLEKEFFKWSVKTAENYFAKIDSDLSPSALEIAEYTIAWKFVFSKIYRGLGGRIRYLVSGGAPLSTEIIKFLRYANLTIIEGYGLTETFAPCTLNPLYKQMPGTVGRPLGDVEISFGPDQEIRIKTQSLFKEYYKNPAATKEAIRDGWFYTGDIGEFTSEGYLKITDRKKDIIITSGGKNVAPQKIENLAKTKPHISQIVIIGDKRNYLTAIIGIEKERFLPLLEEFGLPVNCSLNELAQNSKLKDLVQKEIDEVNLQLAQFETIKKFIIVTEEFTTENFLTPSLKIKRKVVMEKYREQIEHMYTNS